MSHPREPFERLLDVFDDVFKRVGTRHGFTFDPRAGHVGRALRLEGDPLKRGVFLDYRGHWMESDPADPVLVIAFGAWSATHALFKPFFEGRRSELMRGVIDVLERALGDLRTVTVERIDREGKSFEDYMNGAAKT